MKISGLKMEKVTGNWTKLYKEEIHDLCSLLLNRYFWGNVIKVDEIGGACWTIGEMNTNFWLVDVT